MADQEEQQTESEALELTEFRLIKKMAFNLNAHEIGASLAPREALALIQELDNEVGVWALTILLARYFEEQLKIALTAVPELVAASEEDLLKELAGE